MLDHYSTLKASRFSLQTWTCSGSRKLNYHKGLIAHLLRNVKLKTVRKLTDHEVIYSTELTLEINDLKQIDEEISYSLGKTTIPTKQL